MDAVRVTQPVLEFYTFRDMSGPGERSGRGGAAPGASQDEARAQAKYGLVTTTVSRELVF